MLGLIHLPFCPSTLLYYYRTLATLQKAANSRSAKLRCSDKLKYQVNNRSQTSSTQKVNRRQQVKNKIKSFYSANPQNKIVTKTALDFESLWHRAVGSAGARSQTISKFSKFASTRMSWRADDYCQDCSKHKEERKNVFSFRRSLFWSIDNNNRQKHTTQSHHGHMPLTALHFWLQLKCVFFHSDRCEDAASWGAEGAKEGYVAVGGGWNVCSWSV